MPDQLQLRGGTTTEHNSFTGALREVTVDTTKKTLVVHDGSSAGGTALMKESGGNAASSVGIGTGGNNAINIDSSLNVGFGTANPTSNLDIQGAGSPAIKVTDTTNTTTAQVAANNTKVLYGSLTNHAVQIDQNGGAALIIDTNKNVGIGTTSPQVLMHLNASNARFQLTDSTTGTASGDGVIMGLNGSQDFFINNRESSKNLLFFTANTERIRIDSSGRLLVGTTAARGLGKLEIEGTSFENSGLTLVRNVNSTGATSLNICKSRGGIGSVTSVANNDVLGGINFRGADGANLKDACDIRGEVDGTPSQGSDMPGRLVFRTSADGSSSPTERMRIDSSGNVSIGINDNEPAQLGLIYSTVPTYLTSTFDGTVGEATLSVNVPRTSDGSGSWGSHSNGGYGSAAIQVLSHSSSGGYLTFLTGSADNTNPTERMRLESSGNLLVGKTASTAQNLGVEVRTTQIVIGKTASGTVNGIFFAHGTSYVGGLNYSDTGTGLATSSDERLKKNIKDADDAANKIDAIKVRQFNWKSNGKHQEYGFIAQELEPVFANAVATADDDLKTKTVDYVCFVPMLVKELQSLRSRVEALEAA